MEPWEIARQDQLSAGFERFAQLSWTLYNEYQNVGFDEETAFEIVRLLSLIHISEPTRPY